MGIEGQSQFEDGSWEKPPRPRKSHEFVPIEEVSEEDLHPDALSSPPPTPEEELFAQEEAKKMAEEEIEEYPWMEHEYSEAYWIAMDKLAKEFENRTDPHESIEAFLTKRSKYSKKEDIEKESKMLSAGLRKHKGTFRSPEEKGKHQKGTDTIRRSGIDG